MNHLSTKAALMAAALLAGSALPSLAAAPPPLPLAVPNPSYQTIVLETDVSRPAAEVWKRIGKYCDISEWFPGLRCEITAGKTDELGAVRTLNGSTIEILVAKTDLSYSYTQPVRVGEPYNLYHGTLEVKPTTAGSKLVYSLVFDNSMMADAAAKAADMQRRTTTFTTALRNMKTLAEGGTLPPPAPPR